MKKKHSIIWAALVCIVLIVAIGLVAFVSCQKKQSVSSISSSAVSSSVSSENSSSASVSSESSSSVSSESASSALADGYTLYTNTRFGYSVPIPSSLHAFSTGGSSGQTYVSSDNSVICNVSGSNNTDGTSPSDYFTRNFYNRQSGILTKKESGDTAVITWQVDGKFGYIKSVVGTGSIDTLRFQFPVSQKSQYEATAQYMLDNFSTPSVSQSH